jgi:hypothetical protein
MKPRKFEFTKVKEQIDDELYATYHYNVEQRMYEEEFHGRQHVDENEVTDLNIEAVYVMIGGDYAEVRFNALTDEQLMYIECKLKY